MQADNDDRLSTGGDSTGLPLLPLMLGVALVAVASAWFFLGGEEPPAPPPPEPVAVEEPALEPALPPAPDIPERPIEEEAPAEPNMPAVPPPPPLTLDASDEPVREAMAAQLMDTPLAPALANEDLLARAAGLIDATSQGRSFLQVLKLPPPEEAFSVVEIDGTAYVNPDSFQRYDAYAQAVAAVDPAAVATVFHTFRPLLEQAYAGLGYDAGEMDNALVRALDQVIAAPVLEQPAALERDVTTWHYADPALEELPSLSKQLLRMGPENQALIQAQARAVRQALLSP